MRQRPVCRWCVVAAVLAAGAARADEPLRLRLESAAGIDTNLTRTEGDARRTGSLLRLVLDAADELRTPNLVLDLEYHAGARHIPELGGEDGLFQLLGGRLSVPVAPWLVAGLQARLQDRTTRDSADPQDHARVAGGPQLEARWDDLRISVGGVASRLAYKPNPDLSADGLGGTLGVGLVRGAWRGDVRGTWMRHTFDGDRLVSTGTGPTGSPILALAVGEARTDTLQSVSFGVSHAAEWLLGVEYTLAGNTSNSFRAGYVRHLLRANVTVELPLALVLSTQLDLQRVVYDDPQFITLDSFIEDENRSSIKIRLERPLGERWSAVAHVGAWFSPLGGGPAYGRQQALLGVACNLDDAEEE